MANKTGKTETKRLPKGHAPTPPVEASRPQGSGDEQPGVQPGAPVRVQKKPEQPKKED